MSANLDVQFPVFTFQQPVEGGALTGGNFVQEFLTSDVTQPAGGGKPSPGELVQQYVDHPIDAFTMLAMAEIDNKKLYKEFRHQAAQGNIQAAKDAAHAFMESETKSFWGKIVASAVQGATGALQIYGSNASFNALKPPQSTAAAAGGSGTGSSTFSDLVQKVKDKYNQLFSSGPNSIKNMPPVEQAQQLAELSGAVRMMYQAAGQAATAAGTSVQAIFELEAAKDKKTQMLFESLIQQTQKDYDVANGLVNDSDGIAAKAREALQQVQEQAFQATVQSARA